MVVLTRSSLYSNTSCGGEYACVYVFGYIGTGEEFMLIGIDRQHTFVKENFIDLRTTPGNGM